MRTDRKIKNNTVIYQAKNGAIELRGDFSHETVWATQSEMALIFGVTPQNITMHLKSIYKQEELSEKATCKESLQVQTEGEREIKRKIREYNLDVLIAVGYRINSVVGTRFRQWATKTLRGFIVRGYAINKNLIAKNYKQFAGVVEDIKKLIPESSAMAPKDAMDLVSFFADTWLSLDAYDKEILPKGKLTKKKVVFTSEKISKDLSEFKKLLMQKGEVTEIFGKERSRGAVSGIVGNVMQSFGGKELYGTAEEKATHLLYFMIKNHPYTDGNKRSGAYAFVWFLKQANILDVTRLTPSALTALTVLVAESNSKDKDKITKLILGLISIK